MNQWLYRAVGTVGVAGGFLLLGGAAHANPADAAHPAVDPQQLRGLFDDFFKPTLNSAPAPGTSTLDGVLPAGVVPVDVLPVDVLPADVVPAGLVPEAGLAAGRDAPGAGVHPAMGASEPELGSLTGGALSGLPLVGSLTSALPVGSLLPGGSALPASGSVLPMAGSVLPMAGSVLPTAGSVLPAAGGVLPAAGSVPTGSALTDASDLPAALPVAGVEPLRGTGLLDALPLGALPAAGDRAGTGGSLLSSLRPTVSTGSISTELPVLGTVGVDTDDTAVTMPALIGDTMTAQRQDLFAGEHRTGVTEASEGLPGVGDLLDVDDLLGLPALGDLTDLGDLPGLPGLDELPGLPGLGDLPGLPGLGDLPGVPGLGDLPGVPGLGDLPGVPGLGDLPGVPGVGDLPGLPGVGDLPAVPDLPGLPGLGNLPGLPDLGDLAGLGGLPAVPNLPGLGDLPSLPGLGGLPGLGDLPGLPGLPGLGGLPGLPGVGAPDLPAVPAADSAPARRAGHEPMGRHAERPIAGDDAEYL